MSLYYGMTYSEQKLVNRDVQQYLREAEVDNLSPSEVVAMVLSSALPHIQNNLAISCTCATSYETYQGPEVDCVVHGAVQALKDATAEIRALKQEIETLKRDRGFEHVVEVPNAHMDRLRGWLERPNGALPLNRVTLEVVATGGILIRTRPYEAPRHSSPEMWKDLDLPGMWEPADLVDGQTDNT